MRILPKFLAVIVASGVVIALAVTLLAVPIASLGDAGSGEPQAVQLGGLAQRSYVYAADGTVLATLHGEENRQPVALADVPTLVIDAILAVEDSGFWVHDGVDARGVLRAFMANVGAGGISQGGSTITQQLVKLDLLTSEQTLDRKVQELVLAQRLERELSKEEILRRYLNTVYFGNHAYGVQAAAETYFGVSVKDLKVDHAAMLAGLIRNPISYNPIRFPERAKARREVALGRMVDVGAITEDEATVYATTPLPTEVHQVLPQPDDYFVEEVKSALLTDPSYGLGDTYEEREQAVFQGGLKVYTTFSPQAQSQAIAARDARLPLTNGVFPAGTNPDGSPRSGSAAIVSVEPANGAIRTMVGGPGFGTYRYNLVTQNERQPGSSFKTFVLTTLMEQGRSPEDVIDGTGSPCVFSLPAGQEPYEVTNFDNSPGQMGTVRQQTLRSSNCAYVRLGYVAGQQNVVDIAHKMGVRADIQPYPSIALGTPGITPLEMASAYATLANDGVYNAPYMIEKVDGPSGRNVYTHTPAPSRAVSPQTARLVTSVLQDNIRSGTGRAAAIRVGNPAAGKTGTAQGSGDGWFVGYTMDLATAVWIGGLGGRWPIVLGGRGITGGSYPAQIWGDYMTAYHTGIPARAFSPPDPRPGGTVLTAGPADITPRPPAPPPGPPAPAPAAPAPPVTVAPPVATQPGGPPGGPGGPPAPG
ncbi:MAG TPA: transglycosylase domain-containing protein [Acidimicrobiales bacterium]|nr:transglycosylase domain-containing protein [Acidimicrobiales bacterium]